MKSLIAIVLVSLSLYSCTDPIENTVPQDCGIVANVTYESFNYCGELKTKPTQPVFVLVNSVEEMEKLITKCETFTGVLPDFTKKRVLGVSAGPKPTSGYTIKIQSVRENDCVIVVDYIENGPKDGETITSIVTYPIDYVVLPKSNKPISFNKIKEVADYATIGTYHITAPTKPCTGDCQQIFRIESQKVLQYLNVPNFATDFNKSNYKGLVYKEDLAAFILKVPTAIKDLKGKSKTFGTPDSHQQGGVYFELSQAGIVTKIYLDDDNSADQTAEIIAFKKVIKDKIAELKTKS